MFVLKCNVFHQLTVSIFQMSTAAAAACESDALTKSNTIASSEADSVHLDIDAVMQGFRECLKEDTLIMDGYLRAYTEMTK